MKKKLLIAVFSLCLLIGLMIPILAMGEGNTTVGTMYVRVSYGTTAGGSYEARTDAHPITHEPMKDAMNTTMDYGDKITVTATADSGYIFVGWYEGRIGSSYFLESYDENRLISKDASYSFIATEDQKLFAVFKRNESAPKDSTTQSGGVYSLNHDKLTAVLTGPENKKATKLTIPAAVTENGNTYKVVEIKANACKGMTKLTKLTIGKNVTKIGKNAFSGCKKLKTITIKAAKLKKVGSGAFKKISGAAVIKCPKKQLAAYEKLLRKKGVPKTAKFKK